MDPILSKTQTLNRPSPKSRPSYQTRSKKALLLFVILSLVFSSLLIVINVVIDPLQVYHKASWYKPIFSREERYQNPGLAKNYDYDTIIIGTSMTQNFRPSEVGQILNGTTMKLSMEGSTADEHYQIAKLALSTGKVKKVLWGLDYFSLKTNTEEAVEQFPKYLYDDQIWNDYQYWFNYSTYALLMKSLWQMIKGANNTNLDLLNNWNNSATFSKEKVAEAYDKAYQEEYYFGLNEEGLEVVQKNFNDYIFSLVKAYPDVEFYFYYPPYSVLRQVVWYNTNHERFTNQLDMRKWMFAQFSTVSNVKLYDFQSESEWTYQLGLYADLSHHHQDVNSWIVQAIGRDDGKYRVTEQNIDTLNNQLEQDAELTLLNNQHEALRLKVQMYNESVTFTKPKLIGDKELLVPAKEAAKALGLNLDWKQATHTITLKKEMNRLEMTVDSTQAKTSSGAITLETAPVFIQGKVYIPLVAVSSILGFTANPRIEGHEIYININPLR
ncbi:hypothetical protein BVG16_11625 [Paenibacillus selenitireducens]|uniref:Copper amine oxidase-like N-terminal domain-containing protein n=1 Tax=Paenibacillus selenitireducens TaxID=1324314 RepID=A0A1T2XFC3_9BACL|nr:copper amine oxidase N-terminal domain-containing protein [Paenibacillus selenitireducens]OPA78512.1 hypothetical protein BVG16_11625 [Paenibacillus selenitireducens]